MNIPQSSSSVDAAKIQALKKRLEVVTHIPDMEDYARELREDILVATIAMAEKAVMAKLKIEEPKLRELAEHNELLRLAESSSSGSLVELRKKLFDERYK